MPYNWLLVASNVFRIVQPMRIHSLGRLHSSTAIHWLPARPIVNVMSPDPSPGTPPQPPLTKAQMSRTTTLSIYRCLQRHALSDAYHVFNCLRYSNFKHQKSLIKFIGVRSVEQFKDAATQFPCPISPRLSSHTLLHGLLRIGLTKKAYKLTRLMIEDGINVRSRTLQAVMQGLYPPMPPRFHAARPVHTVPIFGAAIAQDRGTHLAISLLEKAQKSWHKRTRSMYKTLLALCILNGEIILGSLLFGYMIRHWQSEVAEYAGANQPTSSPTSCGTDIEARPKQYTPKHLRGRMRPSATMLQPLLEGISTNLQLRSDDGRSVQAALQALAILANLLDQNGLPFSNLSLLLKALSEAPNVDHLVWVTENGRHEQKKAYDYFHLVLGRLINNLPSNAALKYRPGQRLTPALDLPSYNTLLHYAFHHRSSSNLGNAVLNHMVKERHPALKPDITTYNIIMHWGITARNSTLVEKTLSVLRRNPKNLLLVSVVPDELALARSTSPNCMAKSTVQGQDADWAEKIPVHGIPEIDSAILCLYINYLTVIGQPRKAADMFALLLPELQRGRRYLSLYERRALQGAYFHKAVILGPQFFTAILTALYKAGKCGVAERVWLVALAAEAASHNPKYGFLPWSLPVRAYTIMLRCYSAQIRRRDRVIGWGRLLFPHNRTVMSQRRIAAHHLAERIYGLAKSRLPQRALDPEFFKVALKLFSRDIGRDEPMAVRRRYQRRRWLNAQREYAQFGVPPARSNPPMFQVAQDVLDAGYEIPVTYRHLLVGYMSPTELSAQARPLGHHSKEYPTRASPLYIPKVKHTGHRRKHARCGPRYRRSSHTPCQTP